MWNAAMLRMQAWWLDAMCQVVCVVCAGCKSCKERAHLGFAGQRQQGSVHRPPPAPFVAHRKWDEALYIERHPSLRLDPMHL